MHEVASRPLVDLLRAVLGSSEAHHVWEECAKIAIESVVVDNQFLGRMKQRVAAFEPLAHPVEGEADGLYLPVRTEPVRGGHTWRDLLEALGQHCTMLVQR
jgi:hypothetical protein